MHPLGVQGTPSLPDGHTAASGPSEVRVVIIRQRRSVLLQNFIPGVLGCDESRLAKRATNPQGSEHKCSRGHFVEDVNWELFLSQQPFEADILLLQFPGPFGSRSVLQIPNWLTLRCQVVSATWLVWQRPVGHPSLSSIWPCRPSAVVCSGECFACTNS